MGSKSATEPKTAGTNTPGPWIYAGRLGYAHLVKSNTKDIAAVYGHEEAVANTALIVAAPDLLNACREALEFTGKDTAEVIDSNSVSDDDGAPIPGTLDELARAAVEEANQLIETLAAVIAKAEGRI